MAERNASLFRFGVFNPKHFSIAVVGDPTQAEQAAAALRKAGFVPDDVRVVLGDTVPKTERQYHDSKGVLATLAGLFPLEEAALVQGNLLKAARGAVFLAVKAPEHERRTVATGILAAHVGHSMRYYGENTITDL